MSNFIFEATDVSMEMSRDQIPDDSITEDVKRSSRKDYNKRFRACLFVVFILVSFAVVYSYGTPSSP